MNERNIFSRIYRAGPGQGIFARRPDSEIGLGRTECQLPHLKDLDEKSRIEQSQRHGDQRETASGLEFGGAAGGVTGKPRTVR